jgi:hypothetical protein
VLKHKCIRRKSGSRSARAWMWMWICMWMCSYSCKQAINQMPMPTLFLSADSMSLAAPRHPFTSYCRPNTTENQTRAHKTERIKHNASYSTTAAPSPGSAREVKRYISVRRIKCFAPCVWFFDLRPAEFPRLGALNLRQQHLC